jgi:hypothetical protein
MSLTVTGTGCDWATGPLKSTTPLIIRARNAAAAC